jgi:hypothetical protein
MRAWLAAVGGLSTHLTLAVSFGALVACVTSYIPSGPSPWTVFFLASLIPVGPLHFYYSSQRFFTQHLRYLKEQRENELIQQKEYDVLRRIALRWFANRRYGREGIEFPPDDSK